ncbi:MAG TPA: hypothetical protein VD947_00545 [Patescibacteria group bacterium]|nr:hypothetical protein [Patescibacteria group bacterium]
MKIPKTNLNIKGKEGILLVVLFLGIIAPIYYFNIRPSNNEKYSTAATPNISQRVKDSDATKKEPVTEQSALETGPMAASDAKKQTPGSSPAKSSSQLSIPDKCPNINKSLGDKYLNELNTIRAEKQRLLEAIVSSLLSLNKSKKIDLLNQDTRTKELNAYNKYLNGVKSAGCIPSGYSAP